MEYIRSYVLSVSAAAILCAIVSALGSKNGTVYPLLKVMSGVVLAVVVIQPITKVSAINLNRYLDGLNRDAIAAVEAGTAYAQTSAETRIQEGFEAYIQDKAAQLSAELTVEITLADDGSMLPVAAVMEGALSPAAKYRLETILTEALGIPREAQIWK